MPITIRDATAADADAVAAIYAPYVTDTVITFEADPPEPAEMARRIASAQETHAWLVACDDGTVVGYAYAGPYKTRTAYRFACEVSVYLEVGRRRTGAGRALYEALFTRLADLGYLTAIAGVTQPNEASDALHRALGFDAWGTVTRIGWKHGAWHDVTWWQRPLGAGTGGFPPED